MDDKIRKLEQDNRELKQQVQDIMVQLKENVKYERNYGGLDVYDNEVQFRSGVTLKRVPTLDTNLPIGRLWNDAGTLKIKQ